MPAELPTLDVAGTPVHRPTDSLLEEASRELGLALPPSYREFAKRYGAGLTAGLFMIHVPVDKTGAEWSEHLGDTSRDLARELAESVAEKIIDYKPDGSRELVLRLIPFGASENGDILAWDPEKRSEEGEYPVYVIGARKFGVRLAAPDFAGFLRKALEPGVGGIIGRATFQLEPRFEPRPARS